MENEIVWLNKQPIEVLTKIFKRRDSKSYGWDVLKTRYELRIESFQADYKASICLDDRKVVSIKLLARAEEYEYYYNLFLNKFKQKVSKHKNAS